MPLKDSSRLIKKDTDLPSSPSQLSQRLPQRRHRLVFSANPEKDDEIFEATRAAFRRELGEVNERTPGSRKRYWHEMDVSEAGNTKRELFPEEISQGKSKRRIKSEDGNDGEKEEALSLPPLPSSSSSSSKVIRKHIGFTKSPTKARKRWSHLSKGEGVKDEGDGESILLPPSSPPLPPSSPSRDLIPSSSLNSSPPLPPSSPPPLLPVHDIPGVSLEEKGDSPKLLQSIDTVLVEPNEYRVYFPPRPLRGVPEEAVEGSSAILKASTVRLTYPFGPFQEVFPLVRPKVGKKDLSNGSYDPIQDVLSTISVISRCILPDMASGATEGESPATRGRRLVKEMRHALRRMDHAGFVDRVIQYNVLLEKLRRGLLPGDYRKHPIREIPQLGGAKTSRGGGTYDLVSHLLLQVYNRVVSPQVEKLRQYKAFSNNVYGEINPVLTDELLRRCQVDANGVFLDLGCGIGNVVIQAGAQTGCEAYGVEIMSEPARLGQAQVAEFIARSRCYHLEHGPIEVIHGDFLEISRVAQLLSRATVVLANNYAFDSALNQRLLALFLELRDGAKIISLRSFVPMGHRITERNAGSVESILKVQTHRYPPGSVSWTGTSGEYFIHEVDRKPVQAFWKKVRQGRRG